MRRGNALFVAFTAFTLLVTGPLAKALDPEPIIVDSVPGGEGPQGQSSVAIIAE